MENTVLQTGKTKRPAKMEVSLLQRSVVQKHNDILECKTEPMDMTSILVVVKVLSVSCQRNK